MRPGVWGMEVWGLVYVAWKWKYGAWCMGVWKCGPGVWCMEVWGLMYELSGVSVLSKKIIGTEYGSWKRGVARGVIL